MRRWILPGMHAAVQSSCKMAEVDIALNDKGQQYGNLDEASAIARVLRKDMVIWCGDEKQTLGGLRKSEEARAFAGAN